MQHISGSTDTAPPDPPPAGARRFGGWLAAALLGLAIVGLANIRGGPGLEPTDAWVAQTAREMAESTDWHGYIVPHFSGEVRMQKSPGSYWLVNLIGAVRGTQVDLIAIRIPNILAGLLLVGTVSWLTREIAGRRAAAFAAVVTASSGIVLAWTSRGASDMGLAALMAFSLASLWIGTEKRPPGSRQTALWMLGYFAAGLAMLYKMPMPLVCVGLPVVIYLLVMRRAAVLLDWRHLFGLCLFFLPWLPWAILVTQLEPTALHKWKVEYVDRMTGELPNYEDQKSILNYFYYVVIALGFCLPFSASLPGAIARPFRNQPQVDRRGIWLLQIWFWSLMLFFTLSGGKENRYFLPMLAPLLALLGGELAAFFDPNRKARPMLERWATIAIGVAISAAFIVFIRQLHKKWYPLAADVVAWNDVVIALSVAGALFTLMVVSSGLLFAARREHGAFWALAVGTWALWIWTAGSVLPLMSSDLPIRDFSIQLREKLNADEQASLRQVAQQDPRVIWFSDVRFPRVIDQLELLEMQDGKRSRDFETRKIGETIINRLDAQPLALFVATATDYLTFQILAPAELANAGRPMPPCHLWLVSTVGRLDQRFVVFGNRPAIWPEPPLPLPDKLQRRLDESRQHAAKAFSAQPAASPQTTSRASEKAIAP